MADDFDSYKRIKPSVSSDVHINMKPSVLALYV